jgi:hypothetical protein
MKVQEKQNGLELNGTHYLLVFDDDINLFDKNKIPYALSPLLFNFTLEYAIMKVQQKQNGLELNGTHQLLIFDDVINLFDKNKIP